MKTPADIRKAAVHSFVIAAMALSLCILTLPGHIIPKGFWYVKSLNFIKSRYNEYKPEG